ncbi:MAG TPA: site-specific integrase [Verrucomicrobiae bacterium]|nr:site-specific integrase [Verrucomicrobiae bacterium]
MKTVKDGKFPVTVTEGGVSAKIRRIIQIKKGKNYVLYVADYILLGKRKQVGRSTFDEAKQIAMNACREISRGNHLSLTLANDDRLAYLRATEALAPTGVKLDAAIADYLHAVKTLPSGTTLKEAVEFFRRRNPDSLEKRTVRQVADEFLVAKRAAKVTDHHITNLEGRLGSFSTAFNMNIADIAAKEIQGWLDRLPVKGQTKRNYLKAVSALFAFGIRQKYLPKDAIDEVKSIEPPKEESYEIEIFTPSEMRELLAAAKPEVVPFLAIGGFAGLRTAEIMRLDWSEIHLAEKYIEIKAKKAKTGSRRPAPITENLAQWLAPYAKESGPVVTEINYDELVEAVNRKRLEGKDPATVQLFEWKHNALRHSFCSYRLAAIKNVAQVSHEAGNSPQMIFKHYRQLVSESDAGKWFSIVPETPVNIVRLSEREQAAA